jgi:hypothetical protein
MKTLVSKLTLGGTIIILVTQPFFGTKNKIRVFGGKSESKKAHPTLARRQLNDRLICSYYTLLCAIAPAQTLHQQAVRCNVDYACAGTPAIFRLPTLLF